MLHIYRQVTGLQRFRTFVITRERKCEDRYPFDDVESQPKVRSNFVRRFWLKHIKKAPPIVYRGEYGVIEKILSRRKADLLHVYFGHTGVHLLPFIRQWPGPTIVSFHGMDVQTRRHQEGYEEKLRALLKSVPLVLARSHSLKDRLLELGCDEGKFRLNRTGIPLENFPFKERSSPVDGAWSFVQACRLIEKKGLDVALKAFAEFARDHPNARFAIAGEGPLAESMKNLAAELGIAEKVRFAGFLSEGELRSLYESAHAFVHPSQLTADQNQEGVPNSMLEAMATGLPVLATQHGGIPEAVEDGVTGLLGPERDVEALLRGMRELAGNEERWKSMGRAASASVRENFEQSAQIEKLEMAYEEAISLGR
ncbi:MAG: glycosyltransferase [Verrucomicrobiota bacterium]